MDTSAQRVITVPKVLVMRLAVVLVHTKVSQVKVSVKTALLDTCAKGGTRQRLCCVQLEDTVPKERPLINCVLLERSVEQPACPIRRHVRLALPAWPVRLLV